MSVEHFDVLIVGAGLSGIAAAHDLQRRSPRRRYAILEGRDDLGGTWSLFRYPGVRSDSDMHTLGYSFKPWKAASAIAEGPAILDYLRETAREFGIDRHIRFRQRVRSAAWSSSRACWTVEVEAGETRQRVVYTCNFLFLCSGYYNYESGYMPEFPGRDEFRGKLIHPQHWPADVDHRGRRIVVIGSGASAVSLVPALAESAEHVTMLQRSPSYMLSMPSGDRIADLFRRVLPANAAHRLIRWKNLLVSLAFYQLCRRDPQRARRFLRRGLERELPPGVEIDPHFNPRYQPWDQRLCLVRDGDLFSAMRLGRVSVVTDEVERFTPGGVLLKSGQELPADLIVSATGLTLQAFGGIRLEVDGAVVEPARALVYKGLMLRDVPNCAFFAGYTNASWTLRAELSAEYVCRLLRWMDRRGYTRCVPRGDSDSAAEQPLLPLSSGYILRGSDVIPKQGSKRPWTVHQNYLLDLLALRLSRLDDGVLEFSRSRGPEPAGASA